MGKILEVLISLSLGYLLAFRHHMGKWTGFSFGTSKGKRLFKWNYGNSNFIRIIRRRRCNYYFRCIETQTNIIRQIRQNKAECIVTLKANHPTLLSQVKQWFNHNRTSNFEEFDHDYYSSVEKSSVEKAHHHTEKRYVWAIPLEEFGGLHQQEQWNELQTIVVVEYIRYL